VRDLLDRIAAAAPDPLKLTDDEFAKLEAYLKTYKRRISMSAMQRAARGDVAERARLDQDEARWNALRATREYNRHLRAAAPESPRRDDAPPSPLGAGERSEGDHTRPKGIPRAEAETLVRDYLLEHAKANPAAVTRDAVAAGTGVSAGMVSKTAAWKAFRDRRDAGANPGRREVPLTDSMLAIVPAEVETPDELAALIEEQEREQAEESRRHAPS
jgi:hypothetical protein